MNLGSRRTILRGAGTIVVFLMSILMASGQARPEQNGPMAEKVFKNVKVLTGISVNEFMETMGFFSASLAMNCVDCHVPESGGNWDKYADETPLKQTARRMTAMVAAMNKANFGGRRVLTCYSCHRGNNRPLVTPSIAELYAPPAQHEPDELMPPAPRAGTADEILNKYIQAIGGAQQLAKLTSFAAKGTYRGYADDQKYPVEVYGKAPGQRTTVMHGAVGDITTVYDGRTAWVASPAVVSLVPVAELSGGELNGAKLDAALSFPGQLKQALRDWRATFPTTIDNRRVQVLQGTADGRYPVNLYFDSASGLLVRQVRFVDSVVGLSPTQVDYTDYRDVAGIKLPFRVTTSWLDGRIIVELNEVRPNAPIDAARFAKPAAPKSSTP